MNKRQAKKLIKLFMSTKSRFTKHQRDSAIRAYIIMARRYRRYILKQIKANIKKEFSKPCWENISIEPSIGEDIGDVRRELIDFAEGIT